MTNEEVKEALIHKTPVRTTSFLYECSGLHVSAIIYRAPEGKIVTQAELSDGKSRGVMYVNFDQIAVDYKGGEKSGKTKKTLQQNKKL